MSGAKEIVVKPISRNDANRIVRVIHYSKGVVNNSQIHLGVFLGEKCGGVMQFGPSIDKRKMLGLVKGTKWNGFLELNRMAFADWLPRNSESRAIAFAMRWVRKKYPQIRWVVSFADACQCGDGTIYRASGFVLTGINKNKTIWKLADGTITTDISIRLRKGNIVKSKGASSMKAFKDAGAYLLSGFQLRYIFFVDPKARGDLAVPEIGFDRIAKVGAGMFRGKPRAGSDPATRQQSHAGKGGAAPTPALMLECGDD